MRLAPGGVLLALLGCGGTEPDYPPFDGPAPTVSDFTIENGVATAILRDPQGASPIGRTDYTYVYFFEAGSNNQVVFAREWTWTRVDGLTWRVTVSDLVQDWSTAVWHVADGTPTCRYSSALTMARVRPLSRLHRTPA